MPQSAVELAKVLHAVVPFASVKQLIDGMFLKKFEKIKEYCIELHDLENKADDVYEQFLIDLFENEKMLSSN